MFSKNQTSWLTKLESVRYKTGTVQKCTVRFRQIREFYVEDNRRTLIIMQRKDPTEERRNRQRVFLKVAYKTAKHNIRNNTTTEGRLEGVV